MVLLFKVWSACRRNKVFITVEDDAVDIYNQVMLKASQKLRSNGAQLVLEADGTLIDEDEVLKAVRGEVLMLLQPNESWISTDSLSLCTTATISEHDGNDSSGSRSDLNISNSSEANISEPEMENAVPKQVTLWKNFTIPWEKVSTLGMEKLENKKRDDKVITEVTHIVSDHIRAINKNIPAKFLKNIAEQICKKFPDTFEDRDDDGEALGEGFYGIYYKLKERIKYLNRSSSKREGSVVTNIPINKKRKMLSSTAGCSFWNPQDPEDMGDETAEELQLRLKSIDIEVTAFDTEIISMLEKTYCSQRRLINRDESPSLEEIMREWPVLLCQPGIYWHFEKLVNKDITLLCVRMLEKFDKIIAFGLKKQIVTTVPSIEDDKLLAILKIVTSYFVESMNTLVIRLQEAADFTEINENAPFIVAFNENDSTKYKVIMERKEINNGTTSFAHALQQLFALYYNFNLVYPKHIARTLEFLQIYFLKIRPEQGSKNVSKTSQLKLLSLMNKFRD